MRHAMRVRGRLAKASDLVLLIRLEVALEPVPAIRMFLGPLPREDVGGDAVEEPAVVGDNNGTARECKECIFQRAQGLNVKVVRRRQAGGGYHPA